MKRYDFIAIGGGNAGLTAAAKIKAAGFKVALIDKGAIGGLCSLNGCNPKKVFVRTTELLDEIRHAQKYGIDVETPRVDWARVMARKESFTNPVTEQSIASLKSQGIDLISGAPRFTSTNTLTINDEEIEFGGVIISTGSKPRALNFTGAEFVKTTNDILAISEVPKNLVVVGAGVVAYEFGQVFARLGSKVTILANSRALSNEDADIVDAMVDFSKSLNVKTINHAKVKIIRKNGAELLVEYEAEGTAETLSADFILNAAGRVAAIDELDLSKAEVAVDKRGIVTNQFLRSATNPKIFAGGDAHGVLQLSPVASYEGRVVAKNFLENDAEPVNFEGIPRAIYTVPQLASVGLTEAEARKRNLDIAVTNSEMSDWKVYAIIAGGQVAKAKVITENSTGRILGAHLFAMNAGDTINLYALAIRYGLKADDLRNMIFSYPTLASALPFTI
ncbi:MAG: NAD(P)/FAD-dependent oxidoreductase [Acidobacteriota bacterium]